MADVPKQIWFPAKRYGWGWGVPTCWQGWAVLGAYLAVVFGITPLADRHLAVYLALVVVATLVLIGVCWAKGEPPRWRWGKD